MWEEMALQEINNIKLWYNISPKIPWEKIVRLFKA